MFRERLTTDYLLLALDMANLRRGFCAPNPAVGAVIVKDGEVIAKGAHQGPGHAHAEIDAFDQAKVSVQGADLYVTLEPCCHHGRTPPCTDAIIQHGIKRVCYAYEDPNPIVAGEGAAKLRAAGIESEHVSLAEIDQFYESYHYWHQHQRPWVTIKLALSHNNKIAGKAGVPVRITGEDCAKLTHQWRKHSDAILTTANTIIYDDPQLNVRMDEVIAKPVYVLDSNLRTPLDAKIFKTAKSVTIFHNKNCDPKFFADKARCVAMNSDLNVVLESIGQDGVHDLWVEAGGVLFQSIINATLANRVLVYRSSKVLPDAALDAFKESFTIEKHYAQVSEQACGKDSVIEYLLP